jgi:hypothetical protein
VGGGGVAIFIPLQPLKSFRRMVWALSVAEVRLRRPSETWGLTAGSSHWFCPGRPLLSLRSAPSAGVYVLPNFWWPLVQ